jgi:hypothetical protein
MHAHFQYETKQQLIWMFKKNFLSSGHRQYLGTRKMVLKIFVKKLNLLLVKIIVGNNHGCLLSGTESAVPRLFPLFPLKLGFYSLYSNIAGKGDIDWTITGG